MEPLPDVTPLFRANDLYSEASRAWEVAIRQALTPIFKQAVQEGVSLRDLSHIAIGECLTLEAATQIYRGLDHSKAQREQQSK